MKRSPFHLLYKPKLVSRAKALRRSMTAAEKRLWYGLLAQLNVRVLRQQPIDNFIVDFYCAGAKLVIELDGEGHFTSEAIAYDLERTRVLCGYGLRVVRFTNAEVLHDFGAVCARLGALLGASDDPPTPLEKGGFDPRVPVQARVPTQPFEPLSKAYDRAQISGTA